MTTNRPHIHNNNYFIQLTKQITTYRFQFKLANSIDGVEVNTNRTSLFVFQATNASLQALLVQLLAIIT